MQKYNQLSLQDRHKIKALVDEDQNQSDIADLIGVH
jgi:IS30 family transposase